MLTKGIFTKALSSVSHYIYIQILQKIELIKGLENLFSSKALQEFKTPALKESAGSDYGVYVFKKRHRTHLSFLLLYGKMAKGINYVLKHIMKAFQWVSRRVFSSKSTISIQKSQWKSDYIALSILI